MKKIIASVLGATFFICMGFETLYKTNGKNPNVYIQTMDKAVSFSVERVTTQKDREKGLMNRHNLAEDTGMLFIFQHPQIVRMWMKDTYIPLDMIFINRGKVVSIHTNAKPLDETIISSNENIFNYHNQTEP